ncbi:MAG: hypothetical protein DBX40_00690, partial [Clostridiales bacterium]
MFFLSVCVFSVPAEPGFPFAAPELHARGVSAFPAGCPLYVVWLSRVGKTGEPHIYGCSGPVCAGYLSGRS